MQDLIARADKAARLLRERDETIVVAESSTGGLISAALLALPGASAYFLGGAVARLLAQTARQRFSASWAVAESGAAGPTGNRYGDAAGHSCIAVAGARQRALTLETGNTDRVANMQAFAAAALDLLAETLAMSAGKPG